MGKRRRRKLPNGFGSITELKRKTNNFWARVTIGTDRNGMPIRKSLGLFDSYNKAYNTIIVYHDKNYDVDFNNISVEELFTLALEDIKSKYNKSTARNDGKKTISRYEGTFNKYFNGVRKKLFKKLTQADIQNIIDYCEYGYDVKSNIKTVYNAMYNKAKEKRACIPDNFSEFLNLGERKKSELHIPFSLKEIELLWENLYVIDDVDLILISIYTGLRPTELCILKKSKIDLENKYATGGIKTNAGIDREIPFCDKIMPLIINLYNKSGNDYLLPSPALKDGHMAYNTLNNRFKKVFKTLNMKHQPHDGRHTLETQLASLGTPEYMRNAILGHEQEGIGNKVYNHIPLEDKLKAINLLNNIV